MSVVEAHPSLYHYTTAGGLLGIVENQTLWATNIRFLNDAAEHVGFFDTRLAQLASRLAEGKQAEQRARIRTLWASLRKVTLQFNSPYVACFCLPPPSDVARDGLLSQWRGYGHDGGYAIEFESKGIQALLEGEAQAFDYQTSFWGKVEYYDAPESEPSEPETRDDEAIVNKWLSDHLTNDELSGLDVLLDPLTRLSCFHKHRGFAEEAEVRIVAVPANAELHVEAGRRGLNKPRKPIHFFSRAGLLVPHIRLFDGMPKQATPRLPIRRVVVGPHPDRERRRDAAELLLKEHGVQAEVLVSDIPYLGR